MGAVIHGASHKALKHFRKNPAALSVYWNYCARTNYENVAFPSLRLLAKDTSWSTNACKEARDWLVEHGALERVPDYIRPAWRNLAEGEKRRRIGMDRSQYFRPTGVLCIKGTTFSLLYEAQRDNEDTSDTSLDVSPHETSYAVEHPHDDTELDSSSLLDSRKERDQVTVTATSAADDATPHGVELSPRGKNKEKKEQLPAPAASEQSSGVSRTRSTNSPKSTPERSTLAEAIHAALLKYAFTDYKPASKTDDRTWLIAEYIAGERDRLRSGRTWHDVERPTLPGKPDHILEFVEWLREENGGDYHIPRDPVELAGRWLRYVDEVLKSRHDSPQNYERKLIKQPQQEPNRYTERQQDEAELVAEGRQARRREQAQYPERTAEELQAFARITAWRRGIDAGLLPADLSLDEYLNSLEYQTQADTSPSENFGLPLPSKSFEAPMQAENANARQQQEEMQGHKEAAMSAIQREAV